jgi:predicted negative regulator of RcsB-dependent stress response
MPKQPTSPRVPKPAPEPDDKFIFAVERTTTWARTHTRQLIIGGIVLAVVILAGLYYWDSQRRVEAEAATRLTEVQQTVMTGNVPLAIRDLQAYLSTFSGTRAAREARIMLADLLLTQERHQDAIAALGRLPRDLDEPVGIAAAQLLAAAQEGMGDNDAALETYQRIARDARFQFQRRDALSDAARLALDPAAPTSPPISTNASSRPSRREINPEATTRCGGPKPWPAPPAEQGRLPPFPRPERPPRTPPRSSTPPTRTPEARRRPTPAAVPRSRRVRRSSLRDDPRQLRGAGA